MKKTILYSLFLGASISAYSQARLIMNNDAYLVIDNAANLVVDNGAANAIATTGTGGNIISEDENDIILWNVGTSTGVHSIPFRSAVGGAGVKIPMTFDVTSAGTGSGSITASTFRTNNGNLPRPSTVTNMCSNLVADDISLQVVDRFWRVEPSGYTTNPAVTMEFAYDAVNEIGGTNTLTESNLQAQRYDPSIVSGGTTCFSNPGNNGSTGSWQGLLFGTVNTGTKRVSNSIVTPANFKAMWTLTDNTTPLPVTLFSYDALCSNNQSTLNWVTVSEINNDVFVVEKSIDGTSFFEIGSVQGAGNSNVANSYSFVDDTYQDNTTYYRLKQIDFDGTETYKGVIATDCSASDFDVNTFIVDKSSINFNIKNSIDENFEIAIYDARGRIVSSTQKFVNKGLTTIELSNLNFNTGIYMLSIVGETNNFSTKLMKKK